MDSQLISRLESRYSVLQHDRSPWLSMCKDVSRVLLPRAGRFFSGEREKSSTADVLRILDSTATYALRVQSAGMAAGASPRARPWFRATTMEPKLDERADVKQWMAEVTRLLLMIFHRSNTYQALHMLYDEEGAFGTSCAIVMPDFDNVLHSHTLTAGEYCVATDHKGRPDTLYRELNLSVANAVREFGKENLSVAVRNLYDRGSLDARIPIMHAIEPRADRQAGKRDRMNKRFRSIYWEVGNNLGRPLRESGFDEFPAVVTRWHVFGGDVYGGSSGMDALGDIRQMQHQQYRKGMAIDYQVEPALQLPSHLKGSESDFLPGGMTFVDMAAPTGGVRTAFEVGLNLADLKEDIVDVRNRINNCFNVNTFLMLSNMYGGTMTATEVAERHEEKMIVLGPVVERQHDEKLRRLVDIAFSYAVQAGILPPPPQELQGRELNIEFTSMLAQAQRALDVNSIDRYTMAIGRIASVKPEVLDKFDSDEWADIYADRLGIDPDLVVPGEQVAIIRQQRAEAMAEQQRQMALQQGADMAAKLGGVPTDKPSALTDVMSAMGR